MKVSELYSGNSPVFSLEVFPPRNGETMSDIFNTIDNLLPFNPGFVSVTQNFKVLYDADCLVNLKDEIHFQDKKELRKIIKKTFLTNTGRRLAEKLYL